MAAPVLETARRRMSWTQYLALDADTPGEYFDGRLVMAPSPDQQHQLICVELLLLLRANIPAGFTANTGWQWSPAPGLNFIPDVMVYRATDETVRLTSTPVLAVEVLSGNRGDDLVVKTSRYAAAGLVHYWIVDRAAGEILIYQLNEGVYELRQAISDERAEVDLGIATVALSMPDLT